MRLASMAPAPSGVIKSALRTILKNDSSSCARIMPEASAVKIWCGLPERMNSSIRCIAADIVSGSIGISRIARRSVANGKFFFRRNSAFSRINRATAIISNSKMPEPRFLLGMHGFLYCDNYSCCIPSYPAC